METLDHDYTVHSRQYAGDESLLVKFFVDAIKDEAKSLEEGRPVFKDVEWIDIRIPGNRDNVVIRPIRDEDLVRFPRHYAAFKARTNGIEGIVGTLLESWNNPALSKARIAELNSLNIRTVEQLSECPDSNSAKIMGFQQIKGEAKTWIAATKSAAPVLRLTKELEELKANYAKLSSDFERLMAENKSKK